MTLEKFQEIVDQEIFSILIEELGTDAVKSLVRLYLNDVDIRWESLETNLSLGRFDEASKEAHTIKGMAANLGLSDLTNYSENFMLAACAENVDNARTQAKEVEKHIETSKEVFEEWVKAS